MSDPVRPSGPTRHPFIHALLLVLPVAFVIVAHIVRTHGGPFWMWHVLDPSYYYLFDALNLVNLTTPGQPFHPGTPVQMLGALVLKAVYTLQSAQAIADMALADPERHLGIISSTFIALTALLSLALGVFVYRRLDGIWSALLFQLAPFLSMVTLKNAYHVKPEPILAALMLVVSMVVIACLRPGFLDRNRTRLAVGFGILAGFGVATKLTVAPIFVLPLFLLGNLRTVMTYAAASAIAFLLFTAPIWGAYDRLWGFAGQVMANSGAYAAADAAFIDFSTYPRAVLKILSRPVLHVPIIGAVIALLVDRLRQNRTGVNFSTEARALAGVALAVALQVLAVAKQPTANYMVPAYMLAPLALVLIRRLVIGWDIGSAGFRRGTSGAFAAFVCALAILQVFSVMRLNRELAEMVRVAQAVDDAKFAKCARLYVFPPSSHSFAMYRGDWEAGLRHTKMLSRLLPDNDYWFEQNSADLRNAQGSLELTQVLSSYPCLFIRGAHRGPILNFMRAQAPDLQLVLSCSTRDEAVFLAKVDCDGTVQEESLSLQQWLKVGHR